MSKTPQQRYNTRDELIAAAARQCPHILSAAMWRNIHEGLNAFGSVYLTVGNELVLFVCDEEK